MPKPELITEDELQAALTRGPASTGALGRQFGVTRQAIL